jgi:hypothetical protein
MAITFTNHLQANILEPLEALISGEFTQPVSYDVEYVQRGTNWFNLRPLSDNEEEDMANAHVREYQVLVQYYRIVSGQHRRDTHIDAVSAIMERFKRLIRNNTSHGTYFFNGRVEDINYSPELSSDALLVEATFKANVLEVV